jgi:hypothetical protein
MMQLVFMLLMMIFPFLLDKSEPIAAADQEGNSTSSRTIELTAIRNISSLFPARPVLNK